jgi:hypothetical protein
MFKKKLNEDEVDCALWEIEVFVWLKIFINCWYLVELSVKAHLLRFHFNMFYYFVENQNQHEVDCALGKRKCLLG